MYNRMIQQTLEDRGLSADVGEVEAWMRLECGTLDWLSPERWEQEVWLAVECIKADPEASKRLAQSYGL